MSDVFGSAEIQESFERLSRALAVHHARRTGAMFDVQPVHTVYGGAHLFRHDVASKLGAAARAHMETWTPDWVTFARVLGLNGADRLPALPAARLAFEREMDAAADGGRAKHRDAWIAREVWERVRAKLHREPVEDYRVDFEDGYGIRADAEEDAAADACADEMALGMERDTLPPFIGVRVKALDDAWRGRAMRTLERAVGGLLKRTNGRLPRHFVVTLPKVTVPEQVALLDQLLAALEAAHGLARGAIRCELMVETPACLFDEQGRVPLRALVTAAAGRCRGAHLGVYDYTAALDVSALHQSLAHPAAALARAVMQAALAGTRVMLADGAVTRLPLPPKSAASTAGVGANDDAARRAVHEAMRAHHLEVRRALSEGWYQGWDLHPGQLPTRYSALMSFYLEGMDAATERLHRFAEEATRATRVGQVFDDAATARALMNHFLRGRGCGAIIEDETIDTQWSDDLMVVRSLLIATEYGGEEPRLP